jgi:hypothetical protein
MVTVTVSEPTNPRLQSGSRKRRRAQEDEGSGEGEAHADTHDAARPRVLFPSGSSSAMDVEEGEGEGDAPATSSEAGVGAGAAPRRMPGSSHSTPLRPPRSEQAHHSGGSRGLKERGSSRSSPAGAGGVVVSASSTPSPPSTFPSPASASTPFGSAGRSRAAPGADFASQGPAAAAPRSGSCSAQYLLPLLRKEGPAAFPWRGSLPCVDYSVRPDFLSRARHPHITPRMRAIIIEWLSATCEQYMLRRDTFHGAAALLDRYLAARPGLSKGQLYCVGATCLHISGKFEEVNYPNLDNLVEATHGHVSKEQIKEMELDACVAFGWNLQPPTVLHWVGAICQHVGTAADAAHAYFNSLRRFPAAREGESRRGALQGRHGASSSGAADASPVQQCVPVTPELLAALLSSSAGLDDEGYPVVQRVVPNVRVVDSRGGDGMWPLLLPLHVCQRSPSACPPSCRCAGGAGSARADAGDAPSRFLPCVAVPPGSTVSQRTPSKLWLDAANLADACVMHVRSASYPPSILGAAILLVVLRQYEAEAVLSMQEATAQDGRAGSEDMDDAGDAVVPGPNDDILRGSSDAAVLLRFAALRPLVLEVVRQGVFRCVRVQNSAEEEKGEDSVKQRAHFGVGAASVGRARLHESAPMGSPGAGAGAGHETGSSISGRREGGGDGPGSPCFIPVDVTSDVDADASIAHLDWRWELLEDACAWVYRMSVAMPNYRAHSYFAEAASDPELLVREGELQRLQSWNRLLIDHVKTHLEEHAAAQNAEVERLTRASAEAVPDGDAGEDEDDTGLPKDVPFPARPPVRLREGGILSLMPFLADGWSGQGRVDARRVARLLRDHGSHLSPSPCPSLAPLARSTSSGSTLARNASEAPEAQDSAVNRRGSHLYSSSPMRPRAMSSGLRGAGAGTDASAGAGAVEGVDDAMDEDGEGEDDALPAAWCRTPPSVDSPAESDSANKSRAKAIAAEPALPATGSGTVRIIDGAAALRRLMSSRSIAPAPSKASDRLMASASGGTGGLHASKRARKEDGDSSRSDRSDGRVGTAGGGSSRSGSGGSGRGSALVAAASHGVAGGGKIAAVGGARPARER